MKKELWVRLRDYHFDNLVPPHLTDRVAAVFGGVDAPTQAFASKLSRKHGWTARFARHAIREYKKFVYLGVTNTIKVTPSKVIDVVWHEHLLFSRPYREFCDKVLEQPFDHNPELIAADDQTEIFNLQFEATLDAYEREFNCTPPQDVWGVTKFTRPLVARRENLVDASSIGLVTSDNEFPLFVLLPGDSSLGVDSSGGGFSFGGGGAFEGAGGGTSWGDAPADSSDSGGSDSSDSGSSDGGGSSCSSSCGGSGCSS